jgi:hypothetical protein
MEEVHYFDSYSKVSVLLNVRDGPQKVIELNKLLLLMITFF